MSPFHLTGGLLVSTKARLLAFAATSAAVSVAGIAGAALALADDGPSVQQLGQQGQIADGGNVQGWTVGALQPSADSIPYTPAGALWEATATDEIIAGGAQPFIPDFTAQAANGDSYRVLWQASTAEGVNPSALSQGQSTTGKLYFDVTGAAPDSVAYGNRLTWVQPPPDAASAPAQSGGAAQYGYPAPQTGSGSAASGTQSGTGSAAAGSPSTASQGATPQAAPAQTVPVKPAPAAAADDVQGSAIPAQTKPTTAPLDVHDAAVPSTTSQTPPASGSAATPTASAPAPAAAGASATPAPSAAQAAPTTTLVPKPAPAN